MVPASLEGAAAVDAGSCLTPQSEHLSPSSRVGTFFMPHTRQIQLRSAIVAADPGVVGVLGRDATWRGAETSFVPTPEGGDSGCKRRVIFGDDLRNPVQNSVCRIKDSERPTGIDRERGAEEGGGGAETKINRCEVR